MLVVRRNGQQVADGIRLVAVGQARARRGARVRADPRLRMKHRALLPAVFHRRVFDKRRKLFTDAVAQRIGLFVLTVTSRNACFLAQHVHRFGQTVHAKHRHKAIGINQPLFHQEAILKEAGLFI